jgi:hypothetical protein
VGTEKLAKKIKKAGSRYLPLLWGEPSKPGRGRPSLSFSIAEPKLIGAIIRRNTEKILVTRKRSNSFPFYTFVGSTCIEVLVFFGSATGPIDHQAINFVLLCQTKG